MEKDGKLTVDVGAPPPVPFHSSSCNFHEKLEYGLTDPDIVHSYEKTTLKGKAEILSGFPWRIVTDRSSFSQSHECRAALAVVEEDYDAVPSNDPSRNDAAILFPHWSYFSLRHVQNVKWAEDKLAKGNELAQFAWNSNASNISIASDLLRKAERCYKEGLDMIPNHVELLSAYGTLCYKEGRYEAAKELLMRALGETNNNGMNSKSIHDLIDAIDKKLGLRSMAVGLFPHTTAKITLSGRAEKALKDAMAEKEILVQVSDDNQYPLMVDSNTRFDSEASSGSTHNSSNHSVTSLSRSRSRKRKKHGKKKRVPKKHKRHKKKRLKRSKTRSRKRARSEDDSDSSSFDSSIPVSSHSERKYRRLQERKL